MGVSWNKGGGGGNRKRKGACGEVLGAQQGIREVPPRVLAPYPGVNLCASRSLLTVQ